MELAFSPDHEDFLIDNARRRTPGHKDEHGFVDRPGGRALSCGCGCGYPGGPYVPMCPFRPHGVTGLARGDMYKRLRAAWDGCDDCEWEDPPPDACERWGII